MMRFKRYAVSSLWATLISSVLCYLCYFLVDLTFLSSLSGKDTEADVVNFFYSIENQGSGKIYSDPDLVILDISECKEIADIADVIRKAGDYGSKVIGIDIIFKQTPTVDVSQYEYLESAIVETPGIVTACRLISNKGVNEGDVVEQSFYTLKNSVTYGLANSNVGVYYPYAVVEGDTIKTMASLLTGGKNPGKRERYVNYSDKYFDVINAKAGFVEADVRGKIVIVSDMYDYRDYHDLPFYLNGSRRVPGALLLAYAVSSAKNGDWVRKVPAVWCVLIAVLLTYIYTILSYYLSQGDREVKYGSLKNRLVKIAILLFLFFFGYVIFTATGYVVNMVYAILGVAITELSIDILEAVRSLFKRKKKEIA